MKETVIYLDKNAFEKIRKDLANKGVHIQGDDVFTTTITDSKGNKVTKIWDPNGTSNAKKKRPAKKAKGAGMSKNQRSRKAALEKESSSISEETKAVNAEFADIARLEAINPEDPSLVHRTSLATLRRQAIHRRGSKLGKDRTKLKRDIHAFQASQAKQGKGNRRKVAKKTGGVHGRNDLHPTNPNLQPQTNFPQLPISNVGILANVPNFYHPSNGFQVTESTPSFQSMQNVPTYVTPNPPYMPQQMSQLESNAQNIKHEEEQLNHLKYEQQVAAEIPCIKMEKQDNVSSTARYPYSEHDQLPQDPMRVVTREQYVVPATKPQNPPNEKLTYNIWGRRW